MSQTSSQDDGASARTKAPSYAGACFCGAVRIQITGQPVVMGFCHCQSCRQWAAAPVNAFTLWKPDALQVTRGREHLGGFKKTENSHRRWCTLCGGHVFTEHPQWDLVDVYAAVLPEFSFAPALHVNYGERVVRMKDGLPKQKDLPTDFGGSGTLLPD